MPRSGCYTAALPDGPIPQTAFLSRISRRQRVFLTRTAVLERMSGPLCEAVLEPSGPAVTLAELARSNMLLVPLDRHGGWYLQLSEERGSSAPGASALTAAELRLLPLLSTHLSMPEIAGELFLSRNTIKSQAISIYRKLGAASRSQAVTRSRELGLLEG